MYSSYMFAVEFGFLLSAISFVITSSRLFVVFFFNFLYIRTLYCAYICVYIYIVVSQRIHVPIAKRNSIDQCSLDIGIQVYNMDSIRFRKIYGLKCLINIATFRLMQKMNIFLLNIYFTCNTHAQINFFFSIDF